MLCCLVFFALTIDTAVCVDLDCKRLDFEEDAPRAMRGMLVKNNEEKMLLNLQKMRTDPGAGFR